MNSENPLVSVIIPVYNTEEYLTECLDSVCNQTLEDIEIICINDASQDNSLDVLKDYANKDNRIILIENEFNQGQSISRNKGLDIARGEYIAFLDSDDYMELDSYEKLYDFAKNYNHDLVVYDAIRFDEEGTKWKSVLHKKAGYDKIYVKTNIFENKQLIYDTSISKFIKNEFIKENNFEFLESRLYEDLLFSMEVLCASECLGIYPEVKYNWRVRYGYKKSVTQSVSDVKNLKDRLTIIYKILDLLNSQDRTKDLLDIFYLKLAEIDILQFINQLDSGNDEYKRIMFEEAKPFVLTFPDDVFEKLDGIDRSKYVLFLEDQWDVLIALIQSHKNINRDVKELKAKNRSLIKSVKKKDQQLQKQKNQKLLEDNKKLKDKNKALKDEIKVIKSTAGWFKYKVNNIYLRMFRKI